MIDSLPKDEIPSFQDPLVLTIPISESSVSTVLELGEKIKEITGTSFKRSSTPDTSFYPKVTLLPFEDILGEASSKGILESMHNIENSGSMEAKLGKWVLTEKGLLMIELEVSPEIYDFRNQIGKVMTPYRSEISNNSEFGYKYFNTPLHITMATGVSPDDLSKIRELTEGKNIMVKLDSPTIYKMSGEWGKDSKLEVFHKW